jgi:5-methylcytosine-specific restriction endonuclease McrA
MTQVELTCKACQETKSVDHFYRAPSNRSGYMLICKECKITQALAWRKANPEKVRAQRRKRKEDLQYRQKERKRYREKNPDKHRESLQRWKRKNPHKKKQYKYEYRSKLKGNSSLISEKDLKRLAEATCSACGRADDLTLEHVIPVERGGSHSIGNLIILCRKCNSSKNSLTWIEWKYSGRPRALEVFHGISKRST